MSTEDRLNRLARILETADLRLLFARDSHRAERFSFSFDSWRVDCSRHALTDEVLTLLREHATTLDLPHWISALFSGERLNATENLPALHTALRQQSDTPIVVDQKNIMPSIRATQAKIKALSDAVRAGKMLGATGKPLNTIIHIGTGGSHLGVALVCDALYQEGDLPVRFVANLDHHALCRALIGVDLERTLFVVVSKTFTTEEVLTNANTALERLTALTDKNRALSRHFIAVTANVTAAKNWGIAQDHILPMDSFIGGRFSLWSAVGLSIALQSGYAAFEALLKGAAHMDDHVAHAPIAENLAINLALIDWWNTAFLSRRERIFVPYADALKLLSAHIQQLFLESNGKRVDWFGKKLPARAKSIRAVFGGVGTESQHSFFQWLHQGMHAALPEFIVPLAVNGVPQRPQMVAHAIAQAQALTHGRDPLFTATFSPNREETARAARVCVGNVPSTTLFLPDLNAHHLGALIALYEHRAFIESILYRVNPFDQFGVELGKILAPTLNSAITQQTELPEETDSATRAAVNFARKHMSATQATQK